MTYVSRERKHPLWLWTAVFLCFLVVAGTPAIAYAGEETAGDEAAAEEETGLANWTTTIAQIVNFLVLVVLLKYFLYDRITSAIDKRAERIASEQEEARKKQEDADKKEKSYEEKLEELEQNRQKKLQEAQEEADKLREELTRKARDEVDKAKARWQESLQQEQNQFMQSLRSEIGRQVCAVSRKALEQLAGRELESAMVQTFLSQLQDSREGLAKLREKAAGDGLTIQTAFDIPEEKRREIENAVKHNGGSVSVRFETDPSLVCGIEVRGEGAAIGWTLAKYLEDVEEELGKTVRQSSGQE